MPLLAQVLDEAGANGIEPQQVLQHLAEKLRQPGSNDELHDAASLVATLHQLLGDLPALADAGAVKFEMEDGRGMNYWTLPEAELDDPDLASDWARRALAALSPARASSAIISEDRYASIRTFSAGSMNGPV